MSVRYDPAGLLSEAAVFAEAIDLLQVEEEKSFAVFQKVDLVLHAPGNDRRLYPDEPFGL